MKQPSPRTGNNEQYPRRAVWLPAAIVLCGVLLRSAYPSRMAVEHFDEGVYASNLWFGADDGFRYPDRHLYAPPLLPALTEWSMILLGPSHVGCMLVSLLAGGLTIGLIWWVAGEWFGEEAALAAATLAALSDFHILYSRTVLTDVLLCFWLLLAVYLTGETYRRGRHGWAVAAGLATGMAWSTKYNGWLPLAIGLIGLIPWILLNREKTRQFRRYLVSWLIVAVTAAIVWSPVWIDLQSRGGYAAVAANHRRYLVGLSGWPQAFLHQVGNLIHFDGWLSCASLGLAVLVAAGWPGRSRSRLKARMEAESNRAIAGDLTLPPRRFTWNRADRNNHGETLPSCLLVTWFCGLLVTTPLYQPYPRLTLPWLMSAWLGAAAAIGWVSHRICLQSWPAKNSWSLRAGSAVLAVVWAALCGSSVVLGLLAVVGFWLHLRRRVPGWAILTVCLLVSVAAIVWSTGHHPSKGIPGWQPRTGLESIAARIVEDAGRVAKEDQPHRAAEPNLPDSLFYVYAEPGLVFHLAVINHRCPVNDFIVQPAGNLNFADPNARRSSIPTFLVTGPHAYRDRQFADQLADYREQLRLVGKYRYVPSDLLLLNEYHPRELTDPERRPEEKVRLYLLK